MNINTLGIVMRQINANMQMSFRAAEGPRKRAFEPRSAEEKEKKEKKLDEPKAKRMPKFIVEETPKSVYQLRYEANVKRRENEERKKREEAEQKRIKAIYDVVYGNLFNLDIQNQETIRTLAKEITEYLNWSYKSGYAYWSSSLKVDVEDIDYGKKRYFENISLKVIHGRKYYQAFRIELELKKPDAPAYKYCVYWDYSLKKALCYDEGKMKGKFVEHIIDWANDLLNELAKLEQEGEIEKKGKLNPRFYCSGWS